MWIVYHRPQLVYVDDGNSRVCHWKPVSCHWCVIRLHWVTVMAISERL